MIAQENGVRPLRVRPGARFRCVGSGLCCSDVHGLGPVNRRERRTLALISEEVVVHSPVLGAHVLQVGSDGRCLFLGDDQSCALHAGLGPHGKPNSCRRFPFGLVATPHGGRITTDHRCPCRSLAEGPLVTPDTAEEALRDRAGRIRADRRIPAHIRLSARHTVPFAEWERRETALLDRLGSDEDPADVLGGAPFPELDDASWEQVATEMTNVGLEGMDERGRETRFEAALGWFGEAVLTDLGAGGAPLERERPWAPAFDAVEATATAPRTPKRVLADWVADDLWALRWAPQASYEVLQVELGTRLRVAGVIAGLLAEEAGLRPDRAAAEAVTVAELVGTSDWWFEVIRRMRL